jgi:hypothetical protein
MNVEDRHSIKENFQLYNHEKREMCQDLEMVHLSFSSLSWFMAFQYSKSKIIDVENWNVMLLTLHAAATDKPLKRKKSGDIK